MLTLGLDSSVLPRYGTQEGAARGYTPQKKGRPSHHPLFAVVADLRMVLHAWVRPGNTADNGLLSGLLLGHRGGVSRRVIGL